MRGIKCGPVIAESNYSDDEQNQHANIENDYSPHHPFFSGILKTAATVRFTRSVFFNSPFLGGAVAVSTGANCKLRTVTNFGEVRRFAKNVASWLGVASKATVIVISLKYWSFFLAGATFFCPISMFIFLAASSTTF